MKRLIGITMGTLSAFCAFALDVVAHRGESSLAPENTLDSLALAWKNGAKYVEGDFHMNNEGEILCIHSTRELKSLWNIEKKDKDLTLDDAKKSNLKNHKRWAKKYPNARIPTIEEVFKIIPKDSVLVLEVKTFRDGYVEKVEALRKENNLSYDNILLISFNDKAIAEFKEKYPQYKALWLYSMKKSPNGDIIPTAQEAIEICKKIKADGVDVGNMASSRVPKLTKEYVGQFKKEGLAFWVWTEDDLGSIPFYKELGVDGVTTNKSSKMLKRLKKDS